MAATEPEKTLNAYKLSWKAEKLCLSIYSSSITNDESDACRHFVWAALLNSELGREFASRVLGAHEDDPKQPEKERQMDQSNNEVGQKSAENLNKHKKFSEKTLLEEFKKNLKSGSLKILKSRGNK